jgi:predicted naringenin-chalcone synthase
MVTAIIGIGKCAPSFKLTQDEAFKSAQNYCGGDEKQKRALKHLYGRSMIKTRGVVRDENISLFSVDEATDTGSVRAFFPRPRTISDLGPSCSSAFADMRKNATLAEQRRFDPSEIGALVTISCTGFYSPGLDIEIINKLDLNRGVARTHVGFMGCHGAMNGLRVADALSKASTKNGYVLLCAAEICSIHFHYGWNSDNLLANSLFGDGAAALLLAPACGGDNWCLMDSASYVVPDSLEAMSWKVEDHGFTMTLSPTVPALIRTHLRGWLESWLSSLGLTFSDIEAWAIHPGGAKIVEAVGQSLDLSESAVSYSLLVLEEFGNMSSPTVLFVLEKIRVSLGCVPTVVLAFGPGLTIEAAYLCPTKE